MAKFYAAFKISENMAETPEGFLICLGVPIARTGEMEYAKGETPIEPGPDGIARIVREEAEVFRPETIASFEAKPVTINHPDGIVSPDNWKQLAKGVLQNVRRGQGEQKDDLIADLLITDSLAIGLVKNGLREVSCGYDADFVQTGVGQGLQKRIVGNHLALVEQGRAGASYAINDHKGKVIPMKVSDRIKAIFSKAQDDAIALVKDEAAPAAGEKKDATQDAGAYDAMMNAVKDLGAKIDAMKGKDASPAAPAAAAAAAPGGDAPAAPKSMEERMAAMEMAIAKLLEGKAAAGDADPAEEVQDGDDEEEEVQDAEKGSMVGDTASRIEILAPGLKVEGKDAKVKALTTAYTTKDGKSVIDQLTGSDKAPDLKDEVRVNTLFIAASEMLKVSRTSELAGTKGRATVGDLAAGNPKNGRSAEEMNQINAQHYGKR